MKKGRMIIAVCLIVLIMVELLHLPKGSDPFAEDPAAATGG